MHSRPIKLFKHCFLHLPHIGVFVFLPFLPFLIFMLSPKLVMFFGRFLAAKNSYHRIYQLSNRLKEMLIGNFQTLGHSNLDG
jgi:hypothetical protein